ncbi:MAG: hypothetical protein QGG85_03590 [Candidatus Marinimicrobia bacterium]|nr:hypothetical protein [Candidatus Neomarinimicrobiota bacterium]
MPKTDHNHLLTFFSVTVRWMLILSIIFAVPVFAQDEESDEFFFDEEEGFGDEEFFGEEGESFEDEEGFGEEEEFFGEDEGFFDEGEEEFGAEEEFGEEFGGFEEEEEEPVSEEPTYKRGITIQLSGGMPSFRNVTLNSWDGVPNVRISVDLPFFLKIGPVGFRVGAEVATFGFQNTLPIGGQYEGFGAFGVATIPAGPSNLQLGMGFLGSSPAYMGSLSSGFSIANLIDMRIGVRSNFAYNIPADLRRGGTHISWVDLFLSLGMTL